jgi:hypothetical protein
LVRKPPLVRKSLLLHNYQTSCWPAYMVFNIVLIVTIITCNKRLHIYIVRSVSTQVISLLMEVPTKLML